MVDLDRDGKQDLLVADLGALLPEDHLQGSLVWLRQTAPLSFETVPLVTRIPRAADVQAADLDGDGDLDLVAAAFLPGADFELLQRREDLARLTGLGWLEQTRPGVFVPHPLEQARLTHVTLDLADFDGDGDVDLVTGDFVGLSFTTRQVAPRVGPAVGLWVSQARR